MATINIQIEDTWKEALQEEFEKGYFQNIRQFLRSEKEKGVIIYPGGKLIFNAYNLTPFDKVKVVILGQDPYHGPGQAHGLSFSVPAGVPPPPSLVNIFKEIRSTMGIASPRNGNLEGWAKQGVFLLNAILTVQANKPASHQSIGWQNFTDETIRQLSEKRNGLVFMLWGAYAQKKSLFIESGKHLILQAPHPSPFSADRGFFGCKHFSKANDYLSKKGIEPVDWNLNK